MKHVYTCPSQGVQELQKAQRVARLQTGWEKTVEGVKMISQFSLAYCRGKCVANGRVRHDAYRMHACYFCPACRQLYAGDGDSDDEKKPALATLSSAKLALQGVISKAKVTYGSPVCSGHVCILHAEFWFEQC